MKKHTYFTMFQTLSTQLYMTVCFVANGTHTHTHTRPRTHARTHAHAHTHTHMLPVQIF